MVEFKENLTQYYISGLKSKLSKIDVPTNIYSWIIYYKIFSYQFNYSLKYE